MKAGAASWVTTPCKVVVIGLTVVANGLVLPSKVVVIALTVVGTNDAVICAGVTGLFIGLTVEEVGRTVDCEGKPPVGITVLDMGLTVE
jgi:hypothetical protein